MLSSIFAPQAVHICTCNRCKYDTLACFIDLDLDTCTLDDAKLAAYRRGNHHLALRRCDSLKHSILHTWSIPQTSYVLHWDKVRLVRYTARKSIFQRPVLLTNLQHNAIRW